MTERWMMPYFHFLTLIIICISFIPNEASSSIRQVHVDSLINNEVDGQQVLPGNENRELKVQAMREIYESLRQLPKMIRKNRRQGRQVMDYFTRGIFTSIGEFFAAEATPTEIDLFISEMQELAAVIDDAESNSELTVVPEEEETVLDNLWDFVSGAALLRFFDETRTSWSELLNENPWIEATSPLLNSITSGQIANVLNPSLLRKYLRGEASEDEIEVMQFVTVLAAQRYEFPPSCNTSTIYTNRFTAGTCIRLTDCVWFGGESFGSCGLGTGSCCVYHNSCDGRSNQWISHFTNPDELEPGPGVGSCQYKVEPRHENVCQYRLDFEQFRLSGPSKNSICEEDFIEIFGAQNVPRLCGDLTGQHIYVTLPRDDFLQMTVYTSSRASKFRKWNIKVTQINCDSPNLAPAGCLQFYNSTEGNVRSFNFKKRIPFLDRNSYQVRANYGVCVNPLPDYCALIWQENGQFAFSVSGDTTKTGDRFRSAVGVDDCSGDHLIIPGAVFRDPGTGRLTEDTKFCGSKLPKIVTNTQPYIMRVVTDKDELFDEGNNGFDLNFKQVKCD